MLYYITYTNIPTKKAFGHPIVKMCDVFANTEEITLVIPKKQDVKEKYGDIFTYYGLSNRFPIIEVPVISASQVSFLGEKISFLVERISFAVSAFFTLKISKKDVLYSRDILSLLLLRLRNNNLFLEIHYLSMTDNFLIRFSKFVKGVIVVTKYLKKELVDMGYRVDQIFVAPDAVDLDLFEIVKESRSELRTRLSLPQDKKIVLYFGNLFAWKGVYTLVDSMKCVSDDVVLVVVGGSDDTLPEFRKYCEDKEYSNRIMVLGYKQYTERASYLMSADILCIPNSAKEHISRYNTSPLKLFEYMASGVPIIASDLPSLREILSEELAYFVKPDDSLDLGRGINEILADENDSSIKSKKALENVKQFTWDIRAKNILDFIKEK